MIQRRNVLAVPAEGVRALFLERRGLVDAGIEQHEQVRPGAQLLSVRDGRCRFEDSRAGGQMPAGRASESCDAMRIHAQFRGVRPDPDHRRVGVRHLVGDHGASPAIGPIVGEDRDGPAPGDVLSQGHRQARVPEQPPTAVEYDHRRFRSPGRARRRDDEELQIGPCDRFVDVGDRARNLRRRRSKDLLGLRTLLRDAVADIRSRQPGKAAEQRSDHSGHKPVH